jgi:multidrug efflux pump subunit AcrA (membrane-fusion protein)
MRSESPVLQIQKIDIVVVVLFVPEIHLASISPGMRGVVHIPSLDQTFESSVVLINDSHDLKTRTIEVRIGIANPDYLIKPGLFVEVELYPEPHYAQILPPESIIGIGQDTHVLVMEDGKVKRVDLTVKGLSDGRLELLSELDPGANIIADKQRHTLEPGYPVTVDTPP